MQSQLTSNTPYLPDHVAVPCDESYRQCAICRLDHNTKKLVKKGSDDDTNKLSQDKMANQLVICSKCRITAHPTLPKEPRKIHSMKEFANLTCFQIAHTPVGMQIWQRCDVNASKGHRARAYNPQMKHPVCQELWQMYGIQSDNNKARKCKAKEVLDNEEDNNSSQRIDRYIDN
jgi:hypothetical protein